MSGLNKSRVRVKIKFLGSFNDGMLTARPQEVRINNSRLSVDRDKP